MTSSQPPRRPLDSIKVVDLSTSYAGPTASMYLADLGADVVKVERPGGDDARGWGPPFLGGTSAWFASANRNKRSVVLDIRSPQGRAALLALVAQADVFIHNLNPGKVERLGLSSDALMELNPALVYCCISGFGATGPASALPGYDLVAQACSGLMSVTGERGGSPQRVSTALSDIVTAMCAALSINAALVGRAEHGMGDIVDVSLLDSDLALMAPRIASFLAGEEEPAPSGGSDSVLAVYQSFRTADRDMIVAIGTDDMWRRFCEAIGLAELGSDPRLADNAGRRAHRGWLLDQVQEMLAGRPSGEWLRVLGDAQVPASLVRSVSEVVADPQVRAREAIQPVPEHDGLYSVHSPFRLALNQPPRIERHPMVGEHTEQVLEELAAARTRKGVGPERIER